MSKLARDKSYNPFHDIDELPLTKDQKEMVLEWFAQKIWNTLDEPGHCKGYDPLVIDGKTAHSYVFNLNTGGRHHPFTDLKELERLLCREMQQSADYYVRELTQVSDLKASDSSQDNGHAKSPKSASTDNDLIRTTADLFWQFHNDRLKDPNLNDMTPYIQPILATLQNKIAEAVREAKLEQTVHLQVAEQKFGRVDWQAAIYELEPRYKFNAQLQQGVKK